MNAEFKTQYKIFSPLTRQKGQSMVEVLASVVIFSVGILGALTLQTTALSLNQSSYYRAQAIMSATDIIERMRVNESGVTDGYYDDYVSSNPPSDPGCTNGNYCNEAAWAQYDLYQWSNNFTDVGLVSPHRPLLPDGAAQITYNEDSQEYEIQVSWTETEWDTQGSGTKTDMTKNILMVVAI